MLPSQRHVVILDLLQQHQVIAIQDICTHCDCSSITTRRDLAQLEEQGLLRRTHGGAMAAVALPQVGATDVAFGRSEARLSLLDRSDVLIVTPASTSATRVLVERPGTPAYRSLPSRSAIPARSRW